MTTVPMACFLRAMFAMRCGVAVVNTLFAAAKLKLKKSIVTLVPVVENTMQFRSDVADIANTTTPGQDRYAGTITTAAFLKQFVHENVPWVHIDMAPRMTAIKEEALALGVAGVPVRLLTCFLMRMGNSSKE